MGKSVEIYEKSDTMERWKLREYVSSSGRKTITGWRAKFPAGQPRPFMDRFLTDLVKKDKWQSPDVDGLAGSKYRGLSELRWTCGKPYRILGYTISDHVFLMLIGCTHNAKKYDPSDCLNTAVKRKNDIENGAATSDEYQLVTYSRDAGKGV
ncbi:MAG: hypothetical protein ACRD19_17175 [Terriglobia bacterium]